MARSSLPCNKGPAITVDPGMPPSLPRTGRHRSRHVGGSWHACRKLVARQTAGQGTTCTTTHYDPIGSSVADLGRGCRYLGRSWHAAAIRAFAADLGHGCRYLGRSWYAAGPPALSRTWDTSADAAALHSLCRRLGDTGPAAQVDPGMPRPPHRHCHGWQAAVH